MKTIGQYACIIFICCCMVPIQAQTEFSVGMDTFSIQDMPGLHSFAYAQADNKVLFVGGRRDGLHGQFDAFNEAGANKEVFVVDPEARQVWKASTASLSVAIREQLQTAGMQFYQDGDKLLFLGGYGFSPTKNNYITHAALISIDAPALMSAVINGGDIAPHFQQVQDTFFAVAGGGLEKIGETYYLVGGHLFEGFYASGWGGTAKQVYTDAIRKFKLDLSGPVPVAYDQQSTVDQWNLHRRDYNLVPQIMPDGRPGLTIFSGVFQPGQAALPFLNLVNITDSGHAPVENFNQYLTQYHSAKLPVYDSTRQEMHTFFFGGMSQYTPDASGNLIKDNRIPFTNQISRITRDAQGKYTESLMRTRMPFHTGTNSELILLPNTPLHSAKILDGTKFNTDSLLVGYLFGGIQTPSTDLNPYVNDNTSATSAGSVFFKVYLKRSPTVSSKAIPLNGRFDLQLSLYPNPASRELNVSLATPQASGLRLILQNTEGKICREWQYDNQPEGQVSVKLELPPLAPGPYFLTANVADMYMSSQIFFIN